MLMAPGLTKFLKDDHGINLSSPPASSAQSIMGGAEVDSQLRPAEDLQKMLLSVFPTLDSYFQANLLDPRSSTSRSGSVRPSMKGAAKSSKKTSKEPHVAPSTLPGACDMHFLPEHNGHHRRKSARQCRPSVCEVQPLCSLSNVSPWFENENYNSHLAATNESNSENCRVDTTELQSQTKKRVSRQRQLQVRARGLQRRLEAALGQYAVHHCDQQLEGLKTHGLLDHGNVSADSVRPWGDCQQYFPRPQTHFTEIKGFSHSSSAVLRGLQETLDSEATASSSSEDELEEDKEPSNFQEPHVASRSCERKWLEERAELGSRWTWLQLRLAELDGRIQQLIKLNKNIHSTKGCVVLADSRLVTMQMKNALLREMTGFSCTVLDTDNEPCSPARLLRNIERQSAQLSQIVNSLMSPLNLSPLSKQRQPRKDQEAFDSDVLVYRSSKRRRFGVFNADMSCVCARTRPLVSFHKQRLFRLHPGLNNSSSKCSSTVPGLKSCSCTHCSSSESALRCSDPDNGPNGTASSRNGPDSSLLRHFTKGTAREEWAQIPLVVNASPLSPVHYRRHCSAPLYNNKILHNAHTRDSCDKYKPYRCKKRVLGLSPNELGCGLQKEDRVHQIKNADEAVLSCDSSDSMFEEKFVLLLQKRNATRKATRRSNGQRLFNIDNILIPSSLTKVEKLQYKDILTPSWHLLNESMLQDEGFSKKDKDEEMQIEVLTDEVFAQRHLPFEQKEKTCWSFWGTSHCRHSLRSGRKLSRNVRELRTSGEDSSVEWTFTQLDTDEQLSPKECVPKTPWERRVFPLNDDEEKALSCDVLQWCSDSTCTPSSSTSLNSDLLSFESSHTMPLSGGHSMNCERSGN